ncbi:hypothetical protein ACTAF0_30090 [Streptomyces murinus]|uniref:hypothetical protein n=1 Tax=Streptomyces murinus TaxID=33900 RepID=UPI003F465570
MVEPISAAGGPLAKAVTSAITKQLHSKTGTRLGSREERRQVYSRFQDAVTDAYTEYTWLLLEQSLFAVRFGKMRHALVYRPQAAEHAARDGLPRFMRIEAEVFKAYLDLRLVANPAPLDAAGEILSRLDDLICLGLNPSQDVVNETTAGVVAAQRKFTDVCRDDLWYLPQRWQVYRPVWWKARRWRLGRRQLPAAE